MNPNDDDLVRHPGVRRGRRPRRSDAETEQHMIDTGLAMIADHGLAVGLDQLVIEEVIRAAGVSRTSAYRRWPHRELYYTDLLVALAQRTDLLEQSAATLDALRQLLDAGSDAVRTEQGRHRLLVDGLRIILQGALDELAVSPRWRSYLALEASLNGLPEADRQRVGEALAAQDRRFAEQRVIIYRELLGLIGYRVRPVLGEADGLRVLATATGAAFVGSLVASVANPEVVRPVLTTDALGGSPATWSAPVFAMASTFLAMVEPDPDASPDPGVLRAALRGLPDRWAAAREANQG